jgi:site-specific DNA-methyltransferase (adenine-specific)
MISFIQACLQPKPQNEYIRLITSHKSSEWTTPDDFFQELNNIYHFTLDVAATEENIKCDLFYDKEIDGLQQDWSTDSKREDGSPGVIWCNPPYGRKIIDWVRKASEGHTKVLMLLPSRTSTRWFHDFILKFDYKVKFIDGRLFFGGFKTPAPFDSMLVEFH